MVSAILIDRVVAPMITDGPMNQLVFQGYVDLVAVTTTQTWRHGRDGQSIEPQIHQGGRVNPLIRSQADFSSSLLT